MSTSTATSILRLSAILIVFLGLILFSLVLCQIRTLHGATFTPLLQAYIFPAMIMFWGAVLYLLSSRLGKMVTGEEN
jgi:hypothetical protein